MLSFIYRLLTRARKRDEVTQDMIGTFEEARADAQSRGWWSYFRFGIRELAGLLGSPSWMIPRTRWALIVGCALTGLALGAAASYLLPASYTSEAVLQLEPPQIPGTLTDLDVLDTDRFHGHGLDLLRQSVTSRGRLSEIIAELNLYPHERTREPTAVIVQEMRRAIRIERTGDFSIRVAFTYEGDHPGPAFYDHRKAQRVNQELVGLLIDEAFRRQTNSIFQTAKYFQARSDEAAYSWDELNRQSRGLTPADPRFDRLTLDRELARKEYESMRQKLAEAHEAQEISQRREGENLQLLDPASLPESPDIPATEMALYGLGSGLLLGLIASLWLALRRVSGVLLTPEAAPSH